jgi:dihydrofolate reductase
VTGGVERALERARVTVDDRDVVVLGGADIIRQFVRAGLVDELRISLAPVLLGDGTRLSERMGPKQIELERTRVIGAPGVTHLTFVSRSDAAASIAPDSEPAARGDRWTERLVANAPMTGPTGCRPWM